MEVVVDYKYGSSWGGDVLLRLIGRMGWGYIKISGRVGKSFLVIPNLR